MYSRLKRLNSSYFLCKNVVIVKRFMRKSRFFFPGKGVQSLFTVILLCKFDNLISFKIQRGWGRQIRSSSSLEPCMDIIYFRLRLMFLMNEKKAPFAAIGSIINNGPGFSYTIIPMDQPTG